MTRLPGGSIDIAYPMPPDVGNIASPLSYRLRLIYRVALFKKMANKNSKKPQAQYKKDHNKPVRFEPRFAAGDSVLVEPPTVGIRSESQGIRGILQGFPRPTGPYRAISVGPKYIQFNQDGIPNTVSINRLIRVAKDVRPNVDAPSASIMNMDPNPAKEASNGEEQNPYAVKKVVGYEH